MPGSISVALRKAVTQGLTAHLGAHEDFNGTSAPEDEVEVSYGFRFDSSAAQRVFTGNVRADTPSASMRAGRNYRDESGEFDLRVWIRAPDGNVEDSETRAFALGTEVEEWVSDHKNADDLAAAGVEVPVGFIWMTVAGWESNSGPDDSGAGTLLVYRIAWTARLT